MIVAELILILTNSLYFEYNTHMNTQEIIDKNNEAADAAADVKAPDDLPEDISQCVRSKEDGEVRRIVVDRQACIGAGSCVVVTDQLFQLDDGNLAYVVDPNSHDQEEIIMSAQSCPVLAVHLYNKDGKKIFPEE